MYYDYIFLQYLLWLFIRDICCSVLAAMVKVGKEITKMLSDLQSFKKMALIQVLLTKYNTQFSAMQYNSLSNQNVETFIV